MTALTIRRRSHPSGPAQLAKAKANVLSASAGRMPRRQLAWTADLKGLVIHYNAHGHDGHYDCCGDGRAPSRLEAQGGRTDPIRIARCRYRGSILRNAYSRTS